jgi:hypothetical protein
MEGFRFWLWLWVPKMIRLRSEGIFVVGFWWLWDITLTTSLTHFLGPKRFPILALECLNHYPQLKLMTR